MANWSIISGTVLEIIVNDNYLNLTVGTSAEDVKPSNAVYVAKYGNDTTGNGSRARPYLTIQAGLNVISAGQVCIVGTGVYRESITSNSNKTITGDGLVELNGTGITALANSNNSYFKNLKITNYQTLNSTGTSGYLQCHIENVKKIGVDYWKMKDTLVKNVYGTINMFMFNELRGIINNTFIDCVDIRIDNTDTTQFKTVANIFKRCNLSFINASTMDYSLFFQCNFRFNAATPTTPTVLHPSVPTGYTGGVSVDTIEEIRTLHAAAFTTTLNFPFCVVADPLFNSETLGDFSLQLTSPARNLAYDGTYAGYKSVAKKLTVDATEADGDFENSTATNFTIADNSATLTTDATGVILSKVIKLDAERELKKLNIAGSFADRNGEWFDHLKDTSSSTIAAGTNVLTASKVYLVEIASIDWNSVTLPAGARFTAITGQLSFTTTGGGVVREILELPNRSTYEMRVAITGAGSTITNAGTLVVGNYYEVETASITYNSQTLTVGTIFRAVTGQTTFTGSGVVRQIFTTSDVFYPYEVGVKPTANRVGNVSTGAISKGNGDITFDRTALNIFPVYAKYLQLKITVQVENLR